MSTKAKLGLTIAVIAGAVGYMIYTTVSSGNALTSFKHVDEVVPQSADWLHQPMQIHGNIVAGSILKKRGALDYKFALFHGDHFVEVTYTGLVPDSFRDCADLVVTGQLTSPQIFAAEQISAKCPSKYDGKRAPLCGEKLTAHVLAQRGRSSAARP
jgi:cytochrome c-type biogenesis protein CcmE